MDFYRSNCQHPPGDYVAVPTVPNPQVISVDQIDETRMGFFPPAFFRLLDSSFGFVDGFIANSLVPDAFGQDMSGLKMFLATAGYFTDARLTPTRHLRFVETIFNAPIEPEEIEDALGITVDEFSFKSLKFEAICDYINKKRFAADAEEDQEQEQSHWMVLLFFTPVGFAHYISPGIKWDSGCFTVGVVLSRTEILRRRQTAAARPVADAVGAAPEAAAARVLRVRPPRRALAAGVQDRARRRDDQGHAADVRRNQRRQHNQLFSDGRLFVPHNRPDRTIQ
jgi:hypothetical protein